MASVTLERPGGQPSRDGGGAVGERHDESTQRNRGLDYKLGGLWTSLATMHRRLSAPHDGQTTHCGISSNPRCGRPRCGQGGTGRDLRPKGRLDFNSLSLNPSKMSPPGRNFSSYGSSMSLSIRPWASFQAVYPFLLDAKRILAAADEELNTWSWVSLYVLPWSTKIPSCSKVVLIWT